MKTDYDATDDIRALHFTDKLVSQAGSVTGLESEYCLCRWRKHCGDRHTGRQSIRRLAYTAARDAL